MTINIAIALTSAVLACCLVALGLLFCWQAHIRRALWVWPPSALVALGIVPLMTGLVFTQNVLVRIGVAPYPFTVNGPGTLALRIVATLVVIAKLNRVYGGKLLTPRDRTRIVEDSP